MTVQQELDTILSDSVEKKELAGVLATILDRDGNPLYNNAFGNLQIDKPDLPVQNDSIIFLWSCTKLMVSVAALQLIEQGKLSLDDPVAKYLPEIANEKVLTGFDPVIGEPQLRAPRTEMKIIHLVTHTAGYVYEFWSKNMDKYFAYHGKNAGTAFTECSEFWCNMPLESDPGEKYTYGVNTDKLGYVVEAISGLTLPEYIKRNICRPLGMSKTDLRPWKEDKSDLMIAHIRLPDETPGKTKLVPLSDMMPSDTPHRHAGGHCMVGTVPDYTRFLLTLLNGGALPSATPGNGIPAYIAGARILKPETVHDYLFTDLIPRVGCSPSGIGKFGDCIPAQSGNPGEFMPGTKKGWSAGGMLNLENVKGGRTSGSLAWAGMGNEYYWVDPEAGRLGMIATELFPFMDHEVLRLFGEVEKAAYNL